MDKNRPQTFDEAIRAINDAMIAEGANLKDLLQADYANLRTAVEDLAPRVAQQFKETTAPYVDKAREVAGPAAGEFDRQMKKNPYLVLGGVAMGAVALGYLFGRTMAPSSQTPTSDYTGLSYGDVPVTNEMTDNVELA